MVIDSTKLGERIARGGEGEIYPLTEKTCIKIIHPKFRTPDRQKKVEAQVALGFQNTNMISWPQEIVYDVNGLFLGFTMPYFASEKYTLCDILNTNMLNLDQEALVNLALNLAICFQYIHRKGFVFGDCNPKNFLVSLQDVTVKIIDTDSLQFYYNQQLYPCTVGFGGVMAPELLKVLAEKCNNDVTRLPKGAFTKNTDLFSLGILLFQILMLGTHPFTGSKVEGHGSTSILPPETAIYHKNIPYFMGRKDCLPNDVPDIELLSPKLQELFKRTFLEENNRTTEDEFIQALKEYKNTLKQCPNNEKHFYRSTLCKCPFCEVHNEREENDKKIAQPTAVVSGNRIMQKGAACFRRKPILSGAWVSVSNTVLMILSVIAQYLLYTQGVYDRFFAVPDGKERDWSYLLFYTCPYIMPVIGVMITLALIYIFGFGKMTLPRFILMIGINIIAVFLAQYVLLLIAKLIGISLLLLILYFVIRAFLGG